MSIARIVTIAAGSVGLVAACVVLWNCWHILRNLRELERLREARRRRWNDGE